MKSLVMEPITRNQQNVSKPIKRSVRSTTFQDESSSWSKFQISDDVIGTMDYDRYSIKIYGHTKNKDNTTKNEDKKYYFEPTGQLIHRSARSIYNNITKMAEMNFYVNMWSDDVRTKVHRFISDDLKLGPVNKDLVRILPVEKAMIISPQNLPNVELIQDWLPGPSLAQSGP